VSPSHRSTRRWSRLVPVLALALTTVASPIAVLQTAGAASASPVTTGSATQVSATTATLAGTGQVSGQPAPLYVFNYGTTPTYGSTAFAQPVPGSTTGDLTAQLSGLVPSTTYYYQLVAEQGSTVIPGQQQQFATAPASQTGVSSSASGASTTPFPAGTAPTTQPGTTPTTPPTTSPTPTNPTSPTSPSTTVPNSPTAPNAPPGSPGNSGASGGAPPSPTPDGQGYWLATSDGGVTTYGDAQFYGAANALHLTAPVVGLTPTSDGLGYWLVASDGGVFTFGDAKFYGSTGNLNLSAPVIGLTPTPDGKGYWLVAADGGVFAFGDAGYFGSAGGVELPAPVMGMAASSDGQGYWLVLANGAVVNFGDAGYFGSAGAVPLVKPIVGMATTPDGKGYWLVASDGGVFAFGDAQFYGSAVSLHPTQPVVGISTSADGLGYWLVAADGGVFSFGDAKYYGSMVNPTLAPTATARVVAMGIPTLQPLSDVPMQYVILDQGAASTCPGLPWEILAAIGKVESNFGRSTLPGVASGTNSAGAAGPMQIGIGGAAGDTFSAYDHPVGADRASTPVPPGSNPPSPWNPTDAVYAATRDLCSNGAANPDSLNSAILAYNHAQWYANEVETLAARYAGSVRYGAGVSPVIGAAVQLAMSQIGTPYLWGGTTPGQGFDCSGLVQWAYGAAGIALPRTSEQQWAVLPHLAPGAPLEVGDLVFFEPASDGPGHVGIYIGDGLMLDAPHTGSTVRIEPYNWPSYVGAAVP
jgi:cell wall-associated NlpC family hydrolase